MGVAPQRGEKLGAGLVPLLSCRQGPGGFAMVKLLLCSRASLASWEKPLPQAPARRGRERGSSEKPRVTVNDSSTEKSSGCREQGGEGRD